MPSKPKIIAICGSTKHSSTNLKLIKTLALSTSAEVDFDVFTELASLPHFNPDQDKENTTAPVEVQQFRQRLKQADGILICTPEYAMGIPGSLKNAIDWTVSSMEFWHKPTALITASSMGQKSHAALLDVLHIIEADITVETQLLISQAQTKIDADGKIIHEEALKQVFALMTALTDKINSTAK